MTVAIPIRQDRVSPVLDTAVRLLVVTRRRGAEVRRREVLLGPLTPEAFVRSVVEQNVDVVLCAALSENLHRALEKQGVRVRPHLCGTVEAVLRAFGRRQLRRDEFRMPGCWRARSPGKGCRQPPAPAEKLSRKETRTG
jgi:predicted Fe-Mo cluster-binding NifX family protein